MVALAPAVSASAGLALRIEHVSHGFALDGLHLPVLERVSLEVAPGVWQKRWTFNGRAPGPFCSRPNSDAKLVTSSVTRTDRIRRWTENRSDARANASWKPA